jgi:hypothetical protein
LVKNHQIILINFQIIHILCYFAYHILYCIRVFDLESDVLIRRIPINRIWILKKGFGNRFGTETILSVYILVYAIKAIFYDAFFSYLHYYYLHLYYY